MGLDLVELMLAIEDSFRLQIPNGAAEKMTTPGSVIDFVASELRQRPEDQIRPLVAEIVRQLTIEVLGIKPKKYREDATFVGDFGAG